MATVTIVAPDGNPEVWDAEKLQEKLEEGYRRYEDWKAEQVAIAAQKYQEWLANPATVQERFRMLRQARDMKIAATDYLMTADYPISAEMKAEIESYRTVLRNLPAQAGAPWDGGGELTPWPAMPTITKTTINS